MSRIALHHLIVGVLIGMPLAAQAQPAYGRVIEATPIYEEVALPLEECVPISQQQKRCETSTSYEEKLVGYDVLYEYQGKQHAQRMARHPGKRVAIEAPVARESYSSRDSTSNHSATPGKKSYGSIAPGAPVVESIQYQGEAPDPLLNLNMRIGQPPHRP